MLSSIKCWMINWRFKVKFVSLYSIYNVPIRNHFLFFELNNKLLFIYVLVPFPFPQTKLIMLCLLKNVVAFSLKNESVSNNRDKEFPWSCCSKILYLIFCSLMRYFWVILWLLCKTLRSVFLRFGYYYTYRFNEMLSVYYLLTYFNGYSLTN